MSLTDRPWRQGPGCSAESGQCPTCVGYCVKKPGWFLPGEAEKVAEYLGITLQELFDTKLAVDFYLRTPNDGDHLYVLSPAVVGGEPGTEFPGNPNGTCVFLVDGACSIHPVKPHECAVSWCGWRAPEGENFKTAVHHPIALAWEEHRDQIAALLGREPEASFDLFDAMGILFGHLEDP